MRSGRPFVVPMIWAYPTISLSRIRTATLGLAMLSPFARAQSVAAQNVASPTPQQALAAQAGAAFSHATTFSSVVLTGSAIRGADQSKTMGSAQLTARLDGSGSVAIQVGDYVETETFPAYAATSACLDTPNNVASNGLTARRCIGATLWFLPQIALLTAAVNPLLATEPLDNGDPGLLLHRLRTSSLRLTADQLKTQSASRLIIDPTTLLVQDNKYAVSPPGLSRIALPMSVLYSDYFTSNGVTVPGRIRRYLGGTLQLDIRISSVALGS